MGNVLTTSKVLVLDTAAVLTSELVSVRMIRLVPAAAAATASFEDGTGAVVAALSCAASSLPDTINFNDRPLVVTGLELAAIAGTGAKVYVYCN